MTHFRAGVRAGVLGALLLLPGAAAAQHVSLWGGGGIGFFLHGGRGITGSNGHKFTAGAVSFFGDRFRLRYVQGSLERSEGIPSDTGDNDLDYYGFDAVVTRKMTRLPVDIAAGISRFEEAYHEGYPGKDLGGKVFVHRWGPHVSFLRSFPIIRFVEAWIEADVHHAPYQPKQYFVLVDAGLGAHF